MISNKVDNIEIITHNTIPDHDCYRSMQRAIENQKNAIKSKEKVFLHVKGESIGI